MTCPRLPRAAMAGMAALMFGAGAALAQDTNGEAAPADPQIETMQPHTSQQGIPDEAASPLSPAEPAEEGLLYEGPEYQRTHENRGVTIGPSD